MTKKKSGQPAEEQETPETPVPGYSVWHQHLSWILNDFLDALSPKERDGDGPILELDSLIPESDTSALVLISDHDMVKPYSYAFRVAATSDYEFGASVLADPREIKPATAQGAPAIETFDLGEFMSRFAAEYAQACGAGPLDLEDSDEEDMSLPPVVPPSKFAMN